MNLYAPPPPEPTDHGIRHIAEINQNARTAWFGLLALLVFVGVTLLGHKDADFFAFGASTQLPLLGVSFPPEALFWTAPLLTAALYCYLHLYLINLWGALANAPARLGGKPLADLLPPNMITMAALIYRDMQRGDRCVADQPLRIATLVITFLLVWGFGWTVLGLLWIRSLPLHHEWMSLLIGLCLYLSLEFGRINLTLARRLLTDPAARIVTRFVPMRTAASLGLLILISTASWATTEGYPFGESWLYPADLGEVELTVRPADWKDRDTWMEDYEIVWSNNTRIEFDFETKVTDTKQFKDNAFLRRQAAVDALQNQSLRGADLRNARMSSTFLSGADLRHARLEGADLFGARLEGARLFRARLEGANLTVARLEGADLRYARLEGARLFRARLERADLGGAGLEGAGLIQARLGGADLTTARLEGADLIAARLEGAALTAARLKGANLVKAKLEGASLVRANLKSANLRDWSIARASLRSADFTGAKNLSPESLNAAFGDADTILPEGMEKPDHWDKGGTTRGAYSLKEDTVYQQWLVEHGGGAGSGD